ncbi:NADH dehydrogenase [ubiquinone] 1 beta subcomplex subunit 11, mitochondrial [Episyrphus balteatus]|uniref:NADH dehydrogenase [ubiquinone] 1 beta subcomplex subunit 11, mitochondrial n=1 Tax=Episyrphus balteatus TaxID=286459 RepID=UPI0024864AE1|nr:NADH dehydrogenase [ubiquinone] 1 beta subcomplex subunit 11, mitochondrial [Episyrphus balteatus]
MSALIRLNNRAVLRNLIAQTRSIKTSPKNRETAAVSPTLNQAKDDTATKNKNWVSWGFDHHDEAHDRSSTKASFFFSVTLCIVWGTFFWAYSPDSRYRDWAQREGFLELRRREKAGLDLISPNYIEPSAINLPSDEELGNTEIII